MDKVRGTAVGTGNARSQFVNSYFMAQAYMTALGHLSDFFLLVFGQHLRSYRKIAWYITQYMAGIRQQQRMRTCLA